MSATIDNETFGVTYVDDCDFREVTGASLTVDPWGLDVLVRRRRGRADELADEIALYKSKRTIRDRVYKDLVLTEYNATHEGAFATVDLTFKGVFDGRTREPNIKDGTRAASVQLNRMSAVIGTLSGQTMTANYYAPYLSAMYVRKEKPLLPQFRNRIDFRGEAMELFGHTGFVSNVSYFKGRVLAGTAARGRTTALTGIASAYNAVIEIYTPQFERKQVGEWWEVTETNEVRIVPLEGYNLAAIGSI